jgi:hypothetical protein
VVFSTLSTPHHAEKKKRRKKERKKKVAHYLNPPLDQSHQRPWGQDRPVVVSEP